MDERARFIGGASASGNWTKDHPVLTRGADRRLDHASVGSPTELEALDDGSIVIVNGHTHSDAEAAQVASSSDRLQAGRMPPLHWEYPGAASDDAADAAA